MMHILINKLGGCRGAEAEGHVMAWFVGLFATAADEDLPNVDAPPDGDAIADVQADDAPAEDKRPGKGP